jgi:protein arginine kinase activator
MKHKCDKCDRPATVHMTEIVGGDKLEKHLCEQCAAAEGIAITANIPISKLLKDFVLQTSDQADPEMTCDVCGMTLAEFRQHGHLGCPNDYDAFEPAMGDLLERAHDGATQHVGKVPSRAGTDQKKQNALLRLRADLKKAVQAEQYEEAAALRDRIKEMETE